MSASGLRMFLAQLVQEIDDLPGNSALRSQHNLEPHSFRFTPTALYNSLIKEQKTYESTGWKMDNFDKLIMKNLCFKYGEVLTAELLALGGKKLGKGGVSLDFTTSTDSGPQKLSPNMQRLKDDGSIIMHDDDVFQKIKSSYYDSMNAMFQELQDYFGNQDALNSRGKKKGFRDNKGKGGISREFGAVIEGGHEHGAGIAETTLKKCWDAAFEANKVSLAQQGIKSAKSLKSRLQKLGFDLSVIRADDGEGFVIRLEDRSGNSAEGTTVGKLKKEFIAACTSTISKIDLGKIKSSDSIVERNRKLIIKQIADKFKKTNAKVKTENTALNAGSRQAESTPMGRVNVKKAGGIALAGRLSIKTKRKAKRKPKPPKMGLKNLLGIINAKLPQQVASNMGSPRLENRTGRFAQSVRAIDVTETAKGFQSIGYTYARKPYEVYESTSGSRFASSDRDPRTLIDTSIREIAAQFGLGRLFTRRL